MMRIELLVNFSEFWLRLNQDIASAQQSVFVQTFAFEGDTVGRQLSRALLSSPAADKRVLADSFTRVVLNDRFRYAPANLFDDTLRREAGETSAMYTGPKTEEPPMARPAMKRAASRGYQPQARAQPIEEMR